MRSVCAAGKQNSPSEQADVLVTEMWHDRMSLFFFFFFFSHARTFVWVFDVIIPINAIFMALDEKTPSFPMQNDFSYLSTS